MISATRSASSFAAKIVERRGVTKQQRAERVVHRLDGLEAPVSMDEFKSTAEELWSRCQSAIAHLDRVDFILGLDAGGIIPTLGLASASGIPYKIAWKLDLPLPGAVKFSEPHAMRQDVHAYHIEPRQRILVMDDEVTTGMTLVNLAEALRAVGAEPVGAVCLVEDLRYSARQRLASTGLDLVSLMAIGQPCA
ncbi:MAG TPA: phosphoribosyltransferase family protein [Actinocrinis sp.]|nr:phosphoribosyltransferase family protein [Actinocrinis sp.]